MAGNTPAKLIFFLSHVLHFVQRIRTQTSEYHVKFTPKKISQDPQQIYFSHPIKLE
jgi:hypothetical protein